MNRLGNQRALAQQGAALPDDETLGTGSGLSAIAP